MRRVVMLGRAVLDRIDPGAVFVVALLFVLGFGVLGGLDFNGYLDVGGKPMHMFFLDGEGNAPAAFSALLLVGACLATLYVAADAPVSRLRWRILAGFYGFMSIDEGIKIHERLQAATHIAWVKLYLPVMAVAAVAALICIMSIRDLPRAITLLVAGGACWAAAQVLEKLEANPEQGQVAGYWVYATFEECLEMVGSPLFLLAAVTVHQRRRTSRAAYPALSAIYPVTPISAEVSGHLVNRRV